MPGSTASYGHTTRGHNVQNLRDVSGALKPKAPRLAGGFRAPEDWQREVTDTIRVFRNENTKSSRLRDEGRKNAVTAERDVSKRFESTEAALVSKINKAQAVRANLERMLLHVEIEQQHLSRTAAKLLKLGARKQASLAVCEDRQRVRGQRPHRELTNDSVQLHLVTQSSLLRNFMHKLERGRRAIEHNLGKLGEVHAALSADIADKLEGIRIDKLALSAHPADLGTVTGNTQRKALLYPQTWTQSSEATLQCAQHLLDDSAALRRALGKVVAENCSAASKLTDTLEQSIQARIQLTRQSREQLERQMAAIDDEITNAHKSKADMMYAAKAKEGPAALAKHRYMLRKMRPKRELVLDEAEHALAEELNVIRGHSNVLKTQIKLLDQQIDRLEGAKIQVQQNVQDKKQSEKVDIECALLDGRAAPERPKSVASSTVSSLYSFQQTPASRRSQSARASSASQRSKRSDAISVRVQRLEKDLAAARAERTAMEASVEALSKELAA